VSSIPLFYDYILKQIEASEIPKEGKAKAQQPTFPQETVILPPANSNRGEIKINKSDPQSKNSRASRPESQKIEGNKSESPLIELKKFDGVKLSKLFQRLKLPILAFVGVVVSVLVLMYFDSLNTDILVNPDGKKVSRIYWGANDDAVPAIKIFIFEERSITPYSVLLTKGTTTEGTKEVSEILDKDCSKMRPKPTRLIKTLIQLADKGNIAIR
jgi:hypothetical protein